VNYTTSVTLYVSESAYLHQPGVSTTLFPLDEVPIVILRAIRSLQRRCTFNES